ncbi:MAG TPA: acyltransferase [Acidisarcina sp.]|nr:acyltransferase [Acidisarcina sp.]
MRREGRFTGDSLSGEVPARLVKPSRLPALTGLRSFAAMNLVFFHFSNPRWFGWLAPVVDAGFISVSFFLLLSGFILAYNYAERGARGEVSARRFWKARLTRLYPVYLLSLLISVQMLHQEFYAHSRPMFIAGVVLTPLLLQGWSPALSTFWNTPAWTMSTEVFFYAFFPFLIRWRMPRRWSRLIALLLIFWVLGMVAPALYTWLLPDGDPHPGRYTNGVWMRALKYTPLPHLPSFLFGVTLAAVHQRIPAASRIRFWLGIVGFASLYAVLFYGARLPYAMMHDGLLMPLFGVLILGLAGTNPLSHFFGFRGFVMIGEASYCLYLLHFNMWTLLHESGALQWTGLIRFDPWISYALLVLGALAALHLVERPGARVMKRLLNA